MSPSLRLLEQQWLFAALLPGLLQQAGRLGLDVTLGEAWRPEWVAREYARRGEGAAHSLHTSRLALDLNLFRDGEYLRETSDHAELGQWWEAQHVLCRWGGRFSKPDGNHYSLARGGLA